MTPEEEVRQPNRFVHGTQDYICCGVGWAGMGLMTTSFMVVAKGGICGEDICYKRLR